MAAITEKQGTEVTQPKDPQKGNDFTFAGWFDAEIGGKPYTWPHTLNASITMYAHWTPISYAIIYKNLKDGTDNSKNPVSYTKDSGDIRLQEPTRPGGFSFEGWYDNGEFNGRPIYVIPAGSKGEKTFWAKWQKEPLESIGDIGKYLREAIGGGSAEDPVFLPVKIDLASDWGALRTAIGTKYVALDLSECDINGNDFSPDMAGSYEDYIVSLILPDKAEIVKEYAFQFFRNLTSVTGKKVITVEKNAFRDCRNLKTVYLPIATTFGDVAFQGCSKLETAYLPSAEKFGTEAFRDGSTRDHLTVTLGLTAPELGNAMFASSSGTVTVIVKVPTAAIEDYDDTWIEKFKEYSSITVKIETY